MKVTNGENGRILLRDVQKVGNTKKRGDQIEMGR